MKRLFPNLVGATTLLLVLAATGVSAATSHRSGDQFQIKRSDLKQLGRDFRESIDMLFKAEERGALVLGTTMGTVSVRTWSENSVRLVVEKHTSASDANDARRILDMFRVQAMRGGKDLTFTARARTKECARSVGVTFTIWVPSTYRVDIRTENGDIEIPRMAGRFTAHTSEGKISVNCDTDDLDIEVEDHSAAGVSDERDTNPAEGESRETPPVKGVEEETSPTTGPATSSEGA